MKTLGDLEYFVKAINDLGYEQLGAVLGKGQTFRAGDLYCPGCGGLRKMFITPIYVPRGQLDYGSHAEPVAKQLTPALFRMRCVQDDTQFTALLYPGAKGPQLAVLPTALGGMSTPHTPRGVAYYLDQAHRSRSVTAYSGAIAMYRGALEHLLFEQGYTVRMIGPKLAKLEADIAAGTAPAWANNLDSEILRVMKELGDGAIHPNDGNVDAQAAFDSEFLALVEETFGMLLFIVYEAPHEKQARLSALRTKAQVFKPATPPKGTAGNP